MESLEIAAAGQVIASAQKTLQTPGKNANFRKIGEYALALFRRFFGNWCYSGAFVRQLQALACRLNFERLKFLGLETEEKMASEGQTGTLGGARQRRG